MILRPIITILKLIWAVLVKLKKFQYLNTLEIELLCHFLFKKADKQSDFFKNVPRF